MKLLLLTAEVWSWRISPKAISSQIKGEALVYFRIQEISMEFWQKTQRNIQHSVKERIFKREGNSEKSKETT